MNVWALIGVIVRFASRRRRPFALAAVLLLLVAGPLPMGGSGEIVLLNAAGLAWAGLLLVRLAGTGNRNKTTTRRRIR